VAGWPVIVTGWPAGRCATLSGRGARVTHAHVSMITCRVDVYRSRPIGASLLAGRGRPAADAERYRCACLTQGLAGRGDGYQCGLHWGLSSSLKALRHGSHSFTCKLPAFSS